MRKLIGTALLAAGVLVTPSLAVAQMAHAGAKHEFGVDLGIAYSKPDGGDGMVLIGTPVDLRVGFVSQGKVMFEPRFTFSFNSKGGIDTTTFEATSAYTFTPGVNVLIAMGTGGHRAGMYVTVGAAYDIVDLGDFSASQFSINGGIGSRSAYGSGAFRPEAFIRYDLENTSDGIASALTFGVRLGLSLWH
ncbi:MAG TPA: outer membrane beta-barrel protein [Gemmatimonadales bacterium]|jgi:hypothetical protein|nr:outer membrane beta-barrel protein [Gemmatimonadales bacterium]